jgi:oligoribonuclease NrnB/cAMP/cGMP phosphodiesterase (DHH superfamily)
MYCGIHTLFHSSLEAASFYLLHSILVTLLNAILSQNTATHDYSKFAMNNLHKILLFHHHSLTHTHTQKNLLKKIEKRNVKTLWTGGRRQAAGGSRPTCNVLKYIPKNQG